MSVGSSGFAVGHISILLYCSGFRVLRLGFASPVLVANGFRPAVVLWGGCWAGRRIDACRASPLVLLPIVAQCVSHLGGCTPWVFVRAAPRLPGEAGGQDARPAHHWQNLILTAIPEGKRFFLALLSPDPTGRQLTHHPSATEVSSTRPASSAGLPPHTPGQHAGTDPHPPQINTSPPSTHLDTPAANRHAYPNLGKTAPLNRPGFDAHRLLVCSL